MLLILCIYLSINSYYTYTQNKNFEIINEKQSVIIQLPNTEYIEITSRNDKVDDKKNIYEHPFSSNTKVLKSSNLENSIARSNTNTEYIENGDTNNRLIRVIPQDSNTLKVEIYANTQYIYKEGLKYSIQLDYSNKADFRIEKDSTSYTDKGCSITISGDDIEWEKYENSQSIILSKKYELETIFKFNLDINCNNQ